ncbi:MAG: hypothetical protein ABSG24_06095 [Acidimicrobiales bacterium]
MRRLSAKRSAFQWLSFLTASVTCGCLLSTQLPAASSTPGALEFDAPSGLAFGGGHLWVTNEVGNSVTEINPTSGAWIATVAATGDGFDRPTALTSFGADLFVANAVGSVSELLASDGSLVRVISGPAFHFVDPVAIEAVGSTILVLNAGSPSGVGSITEIDALTGGLVRTVSGARFAFRDPVALDVSGPDVFVADKGNSSVTEVSRANGGLIRVIAQQGLSAPDGITSSGGRIWVSDSASNAATEIDRASGRVLATYTDSDGGYGFGSPSVAIASGGNVFFASPFGSSPMVTKVSASSGKPSWYMCNTNGPYYFSLLSAFALRGSRLWVASRSGANSKTPGASTGSLTELSTGSGALITTLPTPQQSGTTTTTSTIPSSTTTSTSTSTTTTTVP